MKRIFEFLFLLYCALAVLFATITWAVMLVDGISPKELPKCLDRPAPFLTSNSK